MLACPDIGLPTPGLPPTGRPRLVHTSRNAIVESYLTLALPTRSHGASSIRPLGEEFVHPHITLAPPPGTMEPRCWEGGRKPKAALPGDRTTTQYYPEVQSLGERKQSSYPHHPSLPPKRRPRPFRSGHTRGYYWPALFWSYRLYVDTPGELVEPALKGKGGPVPDSLSPWKKRRAALARGVQSRYASRRLTQTE